jgi:hypothetical protein
MKEIRRAFAAPCKAASEALYFLPSAPFRNMTGDGDSNGRRYRRRGAGATRIMKRKSFSIVLVTVLLSGLGLWGCESAYRVVVRDDPYKKSVLVRVEMRHKTVEGGLEIESMTYEREIKDGKPLPVTVFFRFYAPSYFNGRELEEKVYLRIDGTYFTLPIFNKKTETETESTYPAGGRRYYWPGPVYTTESRYITGKFQLTPEAEKALGKATEYTFRVYMDSEYTTFTASANQSLALRQFLAAGR